MILRINDDTFEVETSSGKILDIWCYPDKELEISIMGEDYYNKDNYKCNDILDIKLSANDSLELYRFFKKKFEGDVNGN